jgi:ATP-binding cassette subfamily B protein
VSEQLRSEEERAAEARRGPAAAHRGGPPHARVGVPVEKSKDFLPSAKRLLRLLHPERAVLTAVVAFGTVGVVLSALGPTVLGRATDLIFAGVLGRQIPEGVTQAQAAAGLRERGQGRLADLVGSVPALRPGQGVDFGALARVLLLALGLYVGSALLMYAQGWLLTGAVNRTIYALRAAVEDKLGRLPLPYFDAQPRGELLSRVTNDIDNVAQSLQQTLSQLLTSLLTVVAMLTMMVWISPLLALLAIVTIPLSVLVTAVIGKRAQRHFVEQWTRTGQVNAIVEESFTGHGLVKVFGRQEENRALFTRRNDPVLQAVHAAAHPGGVDGQPHAERGRVRGAGLRAPRRPRAGARHPGAGGPRRPARPGGVRGRVLLLRPGASASRAPRPRRRARPDRRHRRPHGRR